MNMDQGAQRWLYKFAHKNFWRICAWYDLDDLIQDGHMCWWKVIRRYPDAKDRPHIMRLFQITFSNYVHDLAKERTSQLDAPIASILIGEATEEKFLDQHETGDYAPTAFAHASAAVRAILKVINQSPERLRKPARRHSDGSRETTNERLCRMIGADPRSIDLIAEIKYCLSE
jgi:cytochrome c oxidase assembly factor CtaG